MRMRIIPFLLVLAGCCVSSIWCELFRSGDASGRGVGEEPRPMNNEVEKDILDKTVDLISKRAYYYGTSGPGKRLPNYDFGLGKRSSKPNFKFGLGKRAGEESMEDYENYDVIPIRFAYVDDNQYENIKRSKPYRFGLGKRDGKEQQQRRSSNSRYNFGLGKR